MSTAILSPAQIKSKIRKYQKLERALRRQAKEFRRDGKLAAYIYASASADVYKHEIEGK